MTRDELRIAILDFDISRAKTSLNAVHGVITREQADAQLESDITELLASVDKYAEVKLHYLVEQRNEALESLQDMWGQYCPLPWTHMFMSAGEGAEHVLDGYGLLKDNREPDYEALTVLKEKPVIETSSELTELKSRKIVAAAIKRDGIVFTGVRHGLIIRDMVSVMFLTDMNKPVLMSEQGFIDSNGKYWQREDAWDVAYKAGQIKKNHGTLYSEDLW